MLCNIEILSPKTFLIYLKDVFHDEEQWLELSTQLEKRPTWQLDRARSKLTTAILTIFFHCRKIQRKRLQTK